MNKRSFSTMDPAYLECAFEMFIYNAQHAKRFAPVLKELCQVTAGIRNTVIEHVSEGGVPERKTTWESHGFCYREFVPAGTEVNLFVYSYGNKPWTCNRDEIYHTIIDGTRAPIAQTIDTELAKKLVMFQLNESHLLRVRHRGFQPTIQVFHKETPYKVRTPLREYHKDQAIDAMVEEIQRLRMKITDLKYRPGGPGFESAREHFENALQRIFGNAL